MQPAPSPSPSSTSLLSSEAVMRHGGAFERLPVMFSSSDALDVSCLQTKSTEFDLFSVNLNILLFRPAACSGRSLEVCKTKEKCK